MNGYSYDVNSPSFQDLWGYTPQAGQQAAAQAPTPAPAPNTPTEAGGINFSDMSNIMPYYQQGQGMINSAYNQQTGNLQGAYDQAQGQLPGFMNQAQGDINTAYTEAQNYLPQMYQGQVQPMMQQAVNQMAGRNMVNSSVGADALGNAMGMANQQILQQQAALGGQRAGLLGQLAGTGYQTRAGLARDMLRGQTGLMSQSLGLMGQMGSNYANQASGLHGREYELLASMLPTLLNNSVPDGGANPGGTPGQASPGGVGGTPVQNFLDQRFTEWQALNPNRSGYDFRNDLASRYLENGNPQLGYAISTLDQQLGGRAIPRPNQ